MSRVSIIEKLYSTKKKSALEFNYDALWAPPIRALLPQQDINELYRIATSLKYNSNIEKKYELIDAVMKPRGFRRGNCGTNRVVYNFLEDTRFIAKIAIDKVGLKDSPAEFKNQNYFKPFCCKIFEVDPTGVIAFVERVNPISSLEEFLSVSDDIFNMMVTKIIGKYVVDDLGTDKFMNYGLRYSYNGVNFGPVIIDFPYAYELDGSKLICNRPIILPSGQEVPCGGEIDYDNGMNKLVCQKCRREYTAKELSNDDNKLVIKMYTEDSEGAWKMRSKIINSKGVLMDSGRESKTYISKEDYDNINTGISNHNNTVSRKIYKKRKPMQQYKKEAFSKIQLEYYNKLKNIENKDNTEPVKVSSSIGANNSRAKSHNTSGVSSIVRTSDDTIVQVITNDKPKDSHEIARAKSVDKNDLESINKNSVEEKSVKDVESIDESIIVNTDDKHIESVNDKSTLNKDNKQSDEDTIIDKEEPLSDNNEEIKSVVESDITKIESEVIPEMDNHVDNYNDDDEYDDYIYGNYKGYNNKSRKRDQKNSKKKKKKYNNRYDDDMSEY